MKKLIAPALVAATITAGVAFAGGGPVAAAGTRELAAELKAGRSIAEVAEAEGVEVTKVTDALVAKGTARIDRAVADGKITAARAAKLEARLPKLAERIVNLHKGDRQGG